MHALLKALKSTLRFEQEMVKRFELDKYLSETTSPAAGGSVHEEDMRSAPPRLGEKTS